MRPRDVLKTPFSGWLDSRVVSDFSKSQSQTVHTHRASVHQAAKLVAAF